MNDKTRKFLRETKWTMWIGFYVFNALAAYVGVVSDAGIGRHLSLIGLVERFPGQSKILVVFIMYLSVLITLFSLMTYLTVFYHSRNAEMDPPQ